jgi:hypothetical protein
MPSYRNNALGDYYDANDEPPKHHEYTRRLVGRGRLFYLLQIINFLFCTATSNPKTSSSTPLTLIKINANWDTAIFNPNSKQAVEILFIMPARKP